MLPADRSCFWQPGLVQPAANFLHLRSIDPVQTPVRRRQVSGFPILPGLRFDRLLGGGRISRVDRGRRGIVCRPGIPGPQALCLGEAATPLGRGAWRHAHPALQLRHYRPSLRLRFSGITRTPRRWRAAVAQPVEQRIRNAWVGGSNPLRGTTAATRGARSPDSNSRRDRHSLPIAKLRISWL